MQATASPPTTPCVRLRSFEVENFRLFRKARLELHPEVTVLVGLNDTGKSTLLEAMSLYGLVQRLGFRKVLERDDFEATGESAARFRCTWDVDGEIWEHELAMDFEEPEEKLSGARGTWQWRPREPALIASSERFKAGKRLKYRSLAQIEPKKWQIESDVPKAVFDPTVIVRSFHVPPSYLFQPSSLARDAPTSLKRPTRTGYGWANWLQALINRRDGSLKELEAKLKELFPYFRRVGLATSDESTITKWRTKGARTIVREIPKRDLYVAVSLSDGSVVWANKASSGLLLALAHLALVYASPEGSLLLLEEPENGLNERITLEMMQAFLAAVRHRDQQLVLTTHNAWWLDLVPPGSIRVVRRDEEGSHIEAPPEAEIRRVLEEQNLYPSEVMSIHGPEGLLLLGRKKTP